MVGAELFYCTPAGSDSVNAVYVKAIGILRPDIDRSNIFCRAVVDAAYRSNKQTMP